MLQSGEVTQRRGERRGDPAETYSSGEVTKRTSLGGELFQWRGGVIVVPSESYFSADGGRCLGVKVT